MIKYIKNCFLLILTCLSLLLFPIYAHAASGLLIEKPVEINNTKQYSSPGETKVTAMPRGRLISSVEITLKDKGNGTIGIYADILCHQPMKELRMWLYLEKWIPEEEVWETVEPVRFTWKAEDFPDQELTMAIATFDIPKMERGQDYHVRGLFGADDLTTELSETWTLTTPDFYLE